MSGQGPDDVKQRFYMVSGDIYFAILSKTYDNATGFFHIIWSDVPGKTFGIYWTDNLSSPIAWNEVDGDALNNLIDHGDTCSWTDTGADSEMGGLAPGEIGTRFYMIGAEVLPKPRTLNQEDNACFLLNAILFRFRSMLITFTLVIWPTVTSSWGFLTKRSASSEMWTSPS